MPLTFNSTLRWEAFVTALEHTRSPTPLFPAAHGGPILALHTIPFSQLEAPQQLKEFMKQLVQGSGVIDHSPDKTSRNSDVFGAMRQIHSNEPKYLPPLGDLSKLRLSSKALVYDQYVKTHKPHTNDQGGGNTTTGFVEYTAGTNDMYNRGGRARIVFDYVNSRIFFSPMHYASWSAPDHTGSRVVIDKPDASHSPLPPNPFFLINF